MKKEKILSEIRHIKSLMDQTIYPLRDKHDRLYRFNYYWDVLDFINWLKETKPEVHESEELDYSFNDIKKFGEIYVGIFDKASTTTLDDEGILWIDTPIDNMITQLFEHVINLKEEQTPSLQSILEGLDKFRADVHSAITQNSVTHAKEFAKEVVHEILQPATPSKKLTKKEQFKEDVKKKRAERKLQLVKKHSKRS